MQPQSQDFFFFTLVFFFTAMSNHLLQVRRWLATIQPGEPLK
jgi:hypothetical protein